MAEALTAIVAGGGFGGLAAAIALAQRRWSVTLYERQPSLRASGSGIYIWENGLRVLDALGAKVVTAQHFRGLAMEQRGGDNEILEAGDFPPDLRLITVPRKDLLEGLRDAALQAGVEIVTGAEVIGASARGEFQFSGGRTAQADLAIGADGIWSSVRRSLGLELVHEQTREGAMRAIISGTQDDLGPHGRDKYIECWNGDRRFLITPLSQGEIYLAFTCFDLDADGRQSPLDKAAWTASFPQWAHLIDRVDELLPWSPYSIIKVKSWSSGRAALVGDSAFAQPPNLGQGGGMAMQSGLALGACMEGVSDPRDIPDALANWETRTRDLVDHCQKWSVLYGEVSALPNDVRQRVMAGAMSDPWVRTQILKAARSEPLGWRPA